MQYSPKCATPLVATALTFLDQECDLASTVTGNVAITRLADEVNDNVYSYQPVPGLAMPQKSIPSYVEVFPDPSDSTYGYDRAEQDSLTTDDHAFPSLRLARTY